MKNDFVSTSTTDVPEAAPAAGAKVEETAKETTEKVEGVESGETAEIEAQDAIETDPEAEAELTDDEGGDEDQKPEEVKPKKKGGFQKKLERKDREIEQLKQMLAQQQQPQTQKPAEKTVENSDDLEPDVEKYESLTDFYKDHSRWAARQEVKAFRKEQEERAKAESAKSAEQAKLSDFHKREDEFSKAAPDYQEIIDENSDYMVSAGLKEAVLASEHGPEIIYTLFKNKTELNRINSLNLVQQVLEIGKLEAKLSKSEQKPEVKTKTAAPPPPKPVGTRSPGKVVKDPSDMSPDEYLEYRRKQKK